MPTNNEQLLRRQFLRAGLINGLALFAGVSVLTGQGEAGAKREPNGQLGINVLIQALRATGNVVCRDAADRLEGSQSAHASFDLHLRNAGLGVVDAVLIAQAMSTLCPAEAHALRSLSMSYNPGLTDAGVVLLAQAFPATLTELGLVGCALGDPGGVALLGWGKKATGLRMICLEGNCFSAGMRHALAALAKEKTNLLVVV